MSTMSNRMFILDDEMNYHDFISYPYFRILGIFYESHPSRKVVLCFELSP